MVRLSWVTLAELPANIARPGYVREAVKPGIVHLGVGAFHRAHQALYVNACLASGQTGSIIGLVVAPEHPHALLDILTDSSIRIVTLTVTEKAYLRGPSGKLDRTNADILEDIANPSEPRTLYGFIAEALARRRAASIAPFTVLSCDNLPENGRTLRSLVVEFSALRSNELARHVEADVAFPSSMVDRIVPATTQEDRDRVSSRLGMTDAWPIVSEPFAQWVVEDNFPTGRPDWEQFGVTMVADVTPYELMKLRMLNGAHSAIAYLGQLLGLQTVAEAFAHRGIHHFVGGLWAEIAATLPEGGGLDPQVYSERLARRFSNRALRHRTAQIANDGSQKLPQRILAPALECLAQHRPVQHLVFVIAAWIAALGARGASALFSDPLDAQLRGIDFASRDVTGVVAAVFEVSGLARHAQERSQLVDGAAAYLSALRSGGVENTLRQFEKEGSQK
jgi:fructuronate reductase